MTPPPSQTPVFKYQGFHFLQGGGHEQANRSQEETQERTKPHLLKLGACDSAIASVPTFVGMFACI